MDLIKDIRYSLRMLRKRPGTSALAVAALALGIGLTATMFSIVNGAFLRGLPFEHSERIVHLGTRSQAQGNGIRDTTPHNFADWRAAQHSFEELAAFYPAVANLSSTGDLPERYAV